MRDNIFPSFVLSILAFSIFFSLEGLSCINPVKSYVTITFDDAYENVYFNAYPLMASYGFRGVVFVIADKIGSNFEGSRTMSLDMLRQLQSYGWEIGSHSCSHVHLTDLTMEEMHHELIDSYVKLSMLGFEVYSISYPGGAYDEDTLISTSTCYTFGRTLDEGINKVDFPSLKLRSVVFQDDNYMYVLDWINRTIRSGGWLIIVCHGIVSDEEALPSSVKGWNHVSAFKHILDFLNTSEVNVLTFKDILKLRNADTLHNRFLVGVFDVFIWGITPKLFI